MSISKSDFLLAQKVVAARQTRDAKNERKAQVLASMSPGAPPSEQATKVAAIRCARSRLARADARVLARSPAAAAR